jgi:putative hydrolase of the HAD superfamily
MQDAVTNFVFDFGAVIFEWNPVKRVENHFQGDWFGSDSARALAQNIFGHSSWHAFDEGLISMHAVIEQTSKRLGIERRLLVELIAPIGDDLAPIESSVQILEMLRARRDKGESCRLFFLSNMPEPYARVLERKHSFLSWFDAGIFSADVKLAKPDIKIYKLLAQQYHLTAENTLFVDDQLLNIQAAQSLGWRVVHLESPFELSEKILRFL